MNQDFINRFLAEDVERAKRFRLLDDDYLTLFFSDNPEGMALVLNIIFERNDMVVTEVVGQREIKSISGHSVRLDILASDSTGKIYDIEVQRADRGALPQRARYNSSMLDTTILKAGEEYSTLIDSYVIFITENDVLKAGLPVYHIDRWVKETQELFGDGSHILYVNGAYRNEDSQIGKLMHDFRCTQPDDMNYDVLAERARYFKESEGGMESMCKMMEDMRNEAMRLNSIQTARRMLQKGKLSYEEIAEYSGLSVEDVEALDEKKTA